MKAIIQRALDANVKVDGKIVGEIEKGFLVLLGIKVGDTKQDADYEAHRKYIDIQFMINGEEYIAVTDISNCVQSIDYNEDKDIAFYKADNSFQTLKSGEFLILYPHDAHKPCISINNARHCKKVVVKILI